MRLQSTLFAAAVTALAMPIAGAQLLVPESTNDDVMMFDAFDGSLINAQFLDMNLSTGTAPGTPQELIYAPNGDILISDQIADRVFRFSADGTTYLGESSTPLDNLRGLESAYGSIWAANAGSANGAPGNAIVQLDQNLNLVNTFAQSFSPWDLFAFRLNGVDGFLVTDGGSNVRFFDPANPAVPVVLAGPGTSLAFSQYLNFRGSTNNLLVAGWAAPSGGYEFDPSTFALVGVIDIQTMFSISGVRSIHELGNGTFLVSGPGVRVYDPVAGTLTIIVPTVAARAITPYQGSTIGVSYCGPAVPNASGNSGTIRASGSAVVTANNLQLTASGLNLNAFAYFLASRTPGFVMNPGGSAGNLCLSGSIGRQVGGSILNSGSTGSVMTATDLSAMPQPNGAVMVQVGETWNFQCWFRDIAGGTATSNFTDAVAVTFN
jgi:hypothetical protein